MVAEEAKKDKFASFGVLSFLAAVHVFIHHAWQQTKYFDKRAYRGWGPGWVACFFVLSGFKLSYSQLQKKDPSKIDPLVPYAWRRLLRLLPLFYVSLVGILLQSLNRGETTHPLWAVLPFNWTLTFTWLGSVAGGWHAGWHGAHWYMSDLLFHQFLWRWTFPVVLYFGRLGNLLLLIVCTGITILRCFMIRWKWAEEETTYWPVYTFNQFVCGMCLAKLYATRPRLTDGAGPPKDRFAIIVCERRVPMSGLTALILMAWTIFYWTPRLLYYYLPNCVWSGIQLPLYVVLVWCLCLEEGPLDWLCHRWPFSLMNEISYGIYIFHWNALMIMAKPLHLPWVGKVALPRSWSEDARFFLIVLPATVLFSWLMAVLVDRPIQAWGSRFLKRAMAAEAGSAHAKTS